MKNNKVNFVIALLMAVALWTYVLLEENPPSTESLKNVPVNYMHEETLKDNGLVVLQKDTQAINISFSGLRSATDNVKASDFRVSADLEGLKEGDNTVRINVSGPEGVSIDNYTPQKAKIHVDKLVSESKPVYVVITNQNNDDSEPHIVQLSRDEINVEGAETLVNRVVRLRAVIDAAKVGDNMKAISVDVEPVDKEGNVVYGVSLAKDRISVTAVLHKTKTVSLNVPVINNDNYFVTREVTVPKTITVKGTEEDLKDVTSIDCEPVDVSHIYENTSVELVPVIPENLEATVESQKLMANITVSGASTAEYTFDATSIILEGVGEGLVPTIEDIDVTVKISGYSDAVEGMNSSHFSLWADIYGFQPGEHKVPLTVVCTNNTLELEYNPKEIIVLIEEKAEETGGEPAVPQEGETGIEQDIQEGQGEV